MTTDHLSVLNFVHFCLFNAFLFYFFFLLARWWQFLREAIKTEADCKYLFVAD